MAHVNAHLQKEAKKVGLDDRLAKLASSLLVAAVVAAPTVEGTPAAPVGLMTLERLGGALGQ